MPKTSTKKNKYGIGELITVPFHLSSGTLKVQCVITDERNVYGRLEVEISPLEGEGSAWVQVTRLDDGTGPTADRSKGWQGTHHEPNPSTSP
jgi:hypothetical protein